MKNFFKKIAALAFIVAALCGFATAPAAAGDNGMEKVSRHYDPAHVGHSHQCNNCHNAYNQQGDNGPYSPGRNICPYCGYANPVPPSPQQPNYYGDMTWTEGRDGVRVYYPANGWTWTEGRDGRRVVYPVDGWTWTENVYGRRVPYPSGYSGQDYSYFLVNLLSREIYLAPANEPHRDLLLRQMRIVE